MELCIVTDLKKNHPSFHILLIPPSQEMYRVPADRLLLAILACAEARVCQTEWLEYTFYAPQRDGEIEGQLVGMFVDYRDMSRRTFLFL